jgi:alpha-L-rhamnosidase
MNKQYLFLPEKTLLFMLLLFLSASVFQLKAEQFPAVQDELLIRKALPVWADGREKEMNLNLGFRGVFQAENRQDVTLKVTASTIYRVFLNGEFIGSGPARAAHGYFRVDEYPVGKRVKNGENIVAIEVAGYNINTYYTLDQPSFLLAEVIVDGKVALATGKNRDFEAFQLTERLQKVERYSFQRPFTEYYRMKEGYNRWRSTREPVMKLKTAVFPPVRLLPRHVLQPGFGLIDPVSIYAKGTVQKVRPEKYYKDRSLIAISHLFKGYPESELEVTPSQEIQELVTSGREIVNKSPLIMGALPLKDNEFYLYDFGVNYSGFIGAKLICRAPSKIIFYFDEMLTDGDVNAKKRQADINNQIVYELAPGTYDLESLESYTFRYLKVIALQGDCRVEKLYVREFACPDNPEATFVSSNYKLNTIYTAAKQTFRQNAVDVLMDCPSRERAGWLCDSYFSAITEKEFTGYSAVAHNFYENYALPDSFSFLPKGMIPMCYPADHNDRNFIPQWSLWFILQIEDYAFRDGDPELVARLKPRIENLLAYFAGFENTDGLLEKLAGWKFVEWSKANSFVLDVSYPTNMLYYAALSAASRLYNNSAWAQKAEHVKQTVLQQSFNGEFFTDNAVRENGQLNLTGHTTEVCQYYAFFFDIATPDTHPVLWKKLISEFGPDRNEKETYPTVFRANAFMGNYMRMDLLSRYGLQTQLLPEIQDYFYAMADRTGTLWEHMQNHASCNHGFASYLAHVLYRDILGISHIDYAAKEVTIRFTDILLDHCSGSIPVGKEVIKLKWERSGKQMRYSVDAPEGFTVKMENQSGYQVEKCESF